MSKKQKRVACDKCFRDDFKSERGLAQRETKAHPYIPPPPPRRETEIQPGGEEKLTILGGHNLQLGDVLWLGRKAVLTKITKTEGSKGRGGGGSLLKVRPHERGRERDGPTRRCGDPRGRFRGERPRPPPAVRQR